MTRHAIALVVLAVATFLTVTTVDRWAPLLAGQQPTIIKGLDYGRVVELGNIPDQIEDARSKLALILKGLGTLQLHGSFGQPIGVNGDRLKVDVAQTDPCQTPFKNDVAISQTASTIIVSGRPGFRIMVCQLRIVANSAEITSEWEGTGSACATGKIVHSGSSTAANGESFAANGGYQSGTGQATVISLSYGNDFCIGQSGSNRVTGKASFVYAQ